MTLKTTTRTSTSSVLAGLRSLVPHRALSFAEALRIADLQATRLRELTGATDDAFPEEAVAGLPRIRIVRRAIPTSGMSYWDGQEWIIALNSREPEARQRFTLLHEYKHIVDHGRADRLYTGTRNTDAEKQAEQAADYFAGCVLMSRVLVKRAWSCGHQTPEALADIFQVSPRAAEVRVAQLGLTDPAPRCQPAPSRTWRRGTPRRYFRKAPVPRPEWSIA
ncbi:ImmA/IrrE family metallo-endopeptidase [Nostocoides australiense]